MNIFTCTTRCFKDAEQRFTQNGDSIVTFKGAVDAGFGDKKTTTWIRFNLWGKRFEKLAQYLLDKTQVAVSGELANREYTDKDGQKRYSLEVRVNEITLVGGKPNNSNAQQNQGNDYHPTQNKKPEFEDDGDDIPF